MRTRQLFGNPDLLVLAPMAGLSHSALRTQIEDFGGCDLYFSEMLSCAALLNNSPYAGSYQNPLPRPDRFIIQLMDSEPDNFVRAAQKLSETAFLGIDVNLGCSAWAIKKRRGGVEWMKDLEGSRRLIAALRAVCPQRLLSAKIRSGFAEDSEYLVKYARALAEAGLDFITLHPRTASEKYGRPARWEWVKLLKTNLSIPVIGNGDIFSFSDYLARRQKAEPDAIMLGRGAAQKPWLFRRIKNSLAGKLEPIQIDLRATWMDFLGLAANSLPPDFHLTRAKRYFFYACDNLPFAHHNKYKIQNLQDLAQIRAFVCEYFERFPQYRWVADN